MSYKEAVEDGIPMREGKGPRVTVYYPPCHYCGRPTCAWTYRRDIKYTCPECRKEAVEQALNAKSADDFSQKEKKLQRAIKRISTVADISAYENAIALVKKNLGHPRWFQSTEEIMVALELIRRGVRAHHQVKIFDYYVDFVLPDLHVILEIDGPLHRVKNEEKRQQIRDDVIRWKLGKGWEIVRISTECIDLNVTRLMTAIEAVRKRKSVHTSSQ